MFTADDILHGNNEIAAAIVIAGNQIASALHALGTGDAATNMGAIEHLASKVEYLANSIGHGLDQVRREISEFPTPNS